MEINRKRVARRLASGLMAGAMVLGGLAISGGSVAAKTPTSKSTDRLAGDDRYETAVAIARDYSTAVGKNGIVVASGESPYDALAASALAGYIDAPIILVQKDTLPASVADFLSDQAEEFRGAIAKKVYIIGGTSAISEDVETAIKSIVQANDPLSPIGFTRIAGADRYETAKLISEVPGLMDANDRLIIVNGSNGRWADALSAAPLAAENKWPVVLTGDGGLNATALAVATKYATLPGSVTEFLLVGGTSVLPDSIATQLDALGVKWRDIDRRGGSDRYWTNYEINSYMLFAYGESKTTGFTGSTVAFASGTSPWDALAAGPWAAAKDTHVLLSASPVPSTPGVSLVGALSVLADSPSTIKMLGGKSAIADSVRDAAIAAAQGTNTTSSISGCEEGRSSFLFSTSDGLSAGEGVLVTASANSLFTLNSVKDSTTSFITGFTDIGTKADGLTATKKLYSVALSSKMEAGDVIAFAGAAENLTGDHKRSIAGASCTVTADTTLPTATIKAVTNDDGDALEGFVVTLSEAMTDKVGAIDALAASLSANAYWSTSSASTLFPVAPAADQVTLTATAVNSSPSTVFVITVSAGSGSVKAVNALTETVTLAKEAVVDLAGNMMAVNASATFLPDSTDPTYTLGTPVCNSNATTVKFERGNLSITAISAALGGSKAGRGLNDYKLRVVNNRGLSVPTIEIDAANKLLVVTADVGYHQAQDMTAIAANLGLDGDWTWGGTGSFTATTSDLSPTRKGQDDCYVKITYSEPSVLTAAALTVDGVSVTPEGLPNGATHLTPAFKLSRTIYFKTTGVSGASVVIAGTTNDVGA
ncbi:MAG: cell wall-binding repeat-containing protein, partial [Actinomycetota bacterium]|nr:cell wall-binding repeat-containing protein [Actinomycetota bacterium]